MGEFLSACSDLFPGEKEPEYRYPKWENIPDTLVSREWLCPNFFEIRDALERLEEEETEFFISWSRSYGYDITTDDPHMMVSHYHDLYGDTVTETEEDADTGEDALIYTAYQATTATCFHSVTKYLMTIMTKRQKIWKSTSKDL